MDWVQGLVTVAGAGEPTMKAGLAIHMYVRSRSRSRAMVSYRCHTNDAPLALCDRDFVCVAVFVNVQVCGQRLDGGPCHAELGRRPAHRATAGVSE